MKLLPPVFGTSDLAVVLKWSPQRVRRWCRRCGVGKKVGPGPKARIEITYAQLISEAPDVYYALLEAGAIFVDCGDNSVEE